VTIPLIGANELADSPLLRNSFLTGLKNVVIDSTLSGTTADGLAWVGSPILNASGYVGLIPRTIDQLLTNGGSITLSGGQVMTASGSSLNLDGGYVHYLGGVVNTTLLIDAYGRPVAEKGWDFLVGDEAQVKALAAAAGGGPEDVRDDGVSLTIATREPAPVLAGLADRGALAGLRVSGATLEDVFLTLTGREYRA